MAIPFSIEQLSGLLAAVIFQLGLLAFRHFSTDTSQIEDTEDAEVQKLVEDKPIEGKPVVFELYTAEQQMRLYELARKGIEARQNNVSLQVKLSAEKRKVRDCLREKRKLEEQLG